MNPTETVPHPRSVYSLDVWLSVGKEPVVKMLIVKPGTTELTALVLLISLEMPGLGVILNVPGMMNALITRLV